MMLWNRHKFKIAAVLFAITIIFVESVAAFDVYESSLWTVTEQTLAIFKTAGIVCLFILSLVSQTMRPVSWARALTAAAAIILFAFIFVANMLVNYHNNSIPASAYEFFNRMEPAHLDRAWSVMEAGVRQVVTALCWFLFGLLWAGEAFGVKEKEAEAEIEEGVEEKAEFDISQIFRPISHSNNGWPKMPEGKNRTARVRALLREHPEMREKMPKDFANHYGEQYYHTFAKQKAT